MAETYEFPDGGGLDGSGPTPAKAKQPEFTLELEQADDNGNPIIEVVDDTPLKDKGRKPLDKEVDDPTDEELNEYSAKVQKRMRELTHARHDERRKAETVSRERAELERVSQVLLQERNALAAEKQRLEQFVQVGQTAYIDKSKTLASSNVDQAKAKLRAAFDAGDSEALANAQQELASAQYALEQANNFSPTPLQTPAQGAYTPENRGTPPAQAQAPQQPLDTRMAEWMGKNPWFKRAGDEDMTGFAEGLHWKLVRERGQAIVGSDEYYRLIDAGLRKSFAERFNEPDAEDDPPRSARPSTVVAPAQRSTTPKKIRLSLSQQSIAKRLGLTLEQYAQYAVKLESQNGR